ncbi:hypothetical protein JXO52_11305 [bacterium]|nr:hypothetical protein [bacterium]
MGAHAGIPPFIRKEFTGQEAVTMIGSGDIGGKASGLLSLAAAVAGSAVPAQFAGAVIDIPRFTVIATDFFDQFMAENTLSPFTRDDLPDERIAHHFQLADLPANLAGDLWALTLNTHVPLAVRSSSLLEDSLKQPFAGIYATKMIPNNQPDAETRFARLTEAIKFVYASTFFKNARNYRRATGSGVRDEKMAVIIQEVAGLPRHMRFYPDISGVIRTYNPYPFGSADPESGIVTLALGLGKTIVDGGVSWSFSPDYPAAPPPCGSTTELLKQTQTSFWAVNMAKSPGADPLRETEFLLHLGLRDAEYDNVLPLLASTYDPASDTVYIGTGRAGPRILNFGPLLQLNDLPFTGIISAVSHTCRTLAGGHVEIEFAATINKQESRPLRFSLLQMRKTAIPADSVNYEIFDTAGAALIVSERILGNGVRDNIRDIVFVRPDTFDFSRSREAAREIALLNDRLVNENRPYILIGFGRWGSSDPWLGIPVNWSQISGASVIVECDHPERSIDFSQGSHFFHNVSNLNILYFSVRPGISGRIDWDWLMHQLPCHSSPLVQHIRLGTPLRTAASFRQRKGVVVV